MCLGKKVMEETGDDAEPWIKFHLNVARHHRAWLHVGGSGIKLWEPCGYSVASIKYHRYRTGSAGRDVYSAEWPSFLESAGLLPSGRRFAAATNL
jgi:hypothetical protein